MKMNREALLATLEAVSPGLAKREQIEQSSCFVFRGDRVYTFNDEVACSHTCKTGFEGAVTAEKLVTLLSKLPEEEVGLEAADGGLRVTGNRKRASVKMEAEIALPIDNLEVPKEWYELPEDFIDAVNIVQQCASGDESGSFALLCVHITPQFIEACDNFQMTRYPLETPVSKPRLVKREALRHIVGLKMSEMAEGKTWLHFRNPDGLTFSCRHHTHEYHNLDAVLTLTDGVPVTLPGGIAEGVDRAEVFSADNTAQNLITVMLSANKLKLKGVGNAGWYEEVRTVVYDGPAFMFKINPKLLVELAKRHNECYVGTQPNPKLKIDTGRFEYVACLMTEDEPV